MQYNVTYYVIVIFREDTKNGKTGNFVIDLEGNAPQKCLF